VFRMDIIDLLLRLRRRKRRVFFRRIRKIYYDIERTPRIISPSIYPSEEDVKVFLRKALRLRRNGVVVFLDNAFDVLGRHLEEYELYGVMVSDDSNDYLLLVGDKHLFERLVDIIYKRQNAREDLLAFVKHGEGALASLFTNERVYRIYPIKREKMIEASIVSEDLHASN